MGNGNGFEGEFRKPVTLTDFSYFINFFYSASKSWCAIVYVTLFGLKLWFIWESCTQGQVVSCQSPSPVPYTVLWMPIGRVEWTSHLGPYAFFVYLLCTINLYSVKQHVENGLGISVELLVSIPQTRSSWMSVSKLKFVWLMSYQPPYTVV